ncbi:MAG: alpha-amylase family glycosyl hydrolase, partial [Candidatus Izemoplasmatales bacterium]|nr:alpha-amylase family glycosyl hydrolase [Candidatus Izemoplasmatales bacterium]
VGETPCLSASRVRDVTGGSAPLLNMVFQFGHVGLDEVPGQGKWNLKKLDIVELKRYFKHMQTSLYQTGWNSLFWANHDQPRAVSRYGNLQYRYESATMLATVLYGMQGTPYVYQGEELGMTGVSYTSLDQFKDIETHNMVKEKLALGWSMNDIMTAIYAKGRDNSRSPMQWDSSPYAGFSYVAPWMDVNPNYQEINAEHEQESIRSVFHYYQELFQIRKSSETFTKGSFELLEETHPFLFIYKRVNENHTLLVIGSFSDSIQSLLVSLPTNGKWLIQNQDTFSTNQHTSIPPYFAGIYEYKNRE